MRAPQLIVGITGAALGVAAERWTYGVDQPLLWLPDLAAGLVLMSAGLAATAHGRGAGWLLTASGFAWFVGTLAPVATYWHRGLLIHLLVSYPAGKPASRTGWIVLFVGYPSVIATPVWREESTSSVLATAGLCVCVVALSRTSVRRRRSRRIACVVGAGLAVVLIAGALVRLVAPAGSAALPSLLAYEATLVVAAVGLWLGLRPAGTRAVTDLVVELGESRSATLRDALADLIGDPSLQLGYWQASTAGYVDTAGRTLPTPAADGDRVMTRIERRGRPFAALVHDAGVATDSTVVDAFAAADRLTSAHASLRADVQARVDDVSASRRRLQIAVDDERHRLERRLAAAPEPRLAEMLADLRRLSAPRDAHVDRAVDQLERTLVDLHDVAYGLYPRELAGGLSTGLGALRERCPVPVRLCVPVQRFDSRVEVAAYYLCAEALTNVVKHSRASAVWVDVVAGSGSLAITVTDDGVGGAEPTGGTGILGLVDRLESIGGHLAITSEVGAGTRLTAEIPLDGQPG